MTEELWQHGFAQLADVKLHYVTAGSGPLVILLHGFPEFWHSWRHQFPALAQHFTVVAPDLRGFGDSDKPSSIASYRLDRLTHDVLGLLQHLGTDRCSLVGHDWGGAIAWAFAADFPGNVERLAILNCPHQAIFARHLLRNFRQFRRSWYMFFFQLPWIPEYAILRDPMVFARRSFRGASVNKEAFPLEELKLYADAISRPGAARGGLNYYRAGIRDLFSGRFKRMPPIQCDTTLIWGLDDPALGQELTDGLESHVRGRLEKRFIPSCGHWVQQERPELVNKHLLEFLLPAPTATAVDVRSSAPTAPSGPLPATSC